MSEARLHRLRTLENRVANTLAIASPSFGCPQETPYGTYCLTSTEQEAMLKQAREKMRRARLVQVRAQEMLLASRRLEHVRDQRRGAKLSLLSELKTEWKAGQTRQLEDLEEECAAALNSVGRAHRAAAKIQRLKEVKEVTDALRTEERHCCAVLRYAEALQKEYAKREELESKKGIALERRKQVEDTAEMDRNLARVSAYGAKIRSKLRQIKQVFQPECKADSEGAKLRDYKYTFMHNHWAALKDTTNEKEDDANAWDAADRKRRDHEQIRLRQGEIAKVAKQRVARRGQAAHVHLAKEQEIRRLENELKNVQRQEKEQKIAAMLSGEPSHVENLSGGQDISLQQAASSPCPVVGERELEDRSPHIEYDTTKTREIKVESLRLSPLEIHVKAVPDSSSVTLTLHVPGNDVDADQAQKASIGNFATAAVRDGSGLHSSPKTGKPESSQAHPHSKPWVMKSVCQAESPRSAKNAAPGTSPKPKAGVRNTVTRSKHNLEKVVSTKESNVEQRRTNLAGKDWAVLKGSRKRQADLWSSTEGNNKRASTRRCLGCGEGNEDMKVGDNELKRASSATSKSCGNLHKSAAHGHGGALASAMSLLDEIWGTAEVLDKLQEAQRRRSPRGKLPVSMKHRIRRTKEQLEALEEELYGQRNNLQGRRPIPKGNPDVLNRSRELPESGSLDERRRKGLEKHMTRMATRSKIDQIGENLWNILPTTDDPVKKAIEGAADHGKEGVAPTTELGRKTTRGKIKGTKLLEASRRQHKQQVKEKSFFSMQLEDFEFLKELQQSLQKLKQSSHGDGCISPNRDRVPASYKGMVKRRSGVGKFTLGSNTGGRGQREPHCGKIYSKANDRSRGVSQDLAPPHEPGTDIGPWNIDKDLVGVHRSSTSKTKRRNGRQPGKAHPLRDLRTQQTLPHKQRGRRVNEQVRVKSPSALTTDRKQNVGSQDSSCTSKGTTERYDAKHPDHRRAASLERQVRSESSAMNLTADDIMEKNSANKVENMSCSSIEITDIEAAVGTALALHDQKILPEEDRGGACDEWLRLQSVATQVTSTDLDPDRGQGGDRYARGGHCESTQTESCAREDSVLASGTPSHLLGNAEWSWGKIWEEVCESIDSELDRLGSGSDLAKVAEEVHNSYCLSTADKLLEGRHSSQPQPVVMHNSELDSSVAGGKDLQVNDVGTETDQPSLDSILGSLSDQVRELDERLRTATSSAVESSWVISESSRRSRQTTSREGLPGSTDQIDRLPVSDTSWLSLPLTVGRPVWKRTDDSFSELETSIPSLWEDANIVPRIRMRRTTVHLEGKGESDGFSSETGSPVSPLGLCFDTLHDMQQRRQNVDPGVLYSHGVVPGGKITEFPSRWVTTDVENSGGHTRMLQLPGKDVQISHVGRSVLVLPCCPRTTHSNEAGDSGQTLRKANLFLTNDETSGNSSECKAGKIVLTSLSSLDLDMGESLLTGSIDFSLWSPEKMRDIFDSPVAPRKELYELLPGSQPARKRCVPLTAADNRAPASKKQEVFPKAFCSRKKTKGSGSYHHRRSDTRHQLSTTGRPMRTLSILGSPGKWTVKPRLVTKTTRSNSAKRL